MKHIMMIERNGIQRIDNGDGTVTMKDTEQGITQTFRCNRMIAHKMDPEHCDHASAKPTYRGPDGNLDYCPACQSLIDADTGEIIRQSKQIPY